MLLCFLQGNHFFRLKENLFPTWFSHKIWEVWHAEAEQTTQKWTNLAETTVQKNKIKLDIKLNLKRKLKPGAHGDRIE